MPSERHTGLLCVEAQFDRHAYAGRRDCARLLAGGRAVDDLLLVGAKTPQLLATLIALPVLLDLDLQLTCCSVSSEKKHDHVINFPARS
jgi:hypothetical protein